MWIKEIWREIKLQATKNTYKRFLYESFKKIKTKEQITVIDLVDDIEEFIYFNKSSDNKEILKKCWELIYLLEQKFPYE